MLSHLLPTVQAFFWSWSRDMRFQDIPTEVHPGCACVYGNVGGDQANHWLSVPGYVHCQLYCNAFFTLCFSPFSIYTAAARPFIWSDHNKRSFFIDSWMKEAATPCEIVRKCWEMVRTPERISEISIFIFPHPRNFTMHHTQAGSIEHAEQWKWQRIWLVWWGRRPWYALYRR